MLLYSRIICIIALLLTSASLKAQHRFSATVHLSSTLQPNCLRLAYDDGLTVHAIKPIFVHRTAHISGLYYGPYAELSVTYPKQTQTDSLETSFFLTTQKATITFVPTVDQADLLRLSKTTHVLSAAQVGQTIYQQFIAPQQRDFINFVLIETT